MRNYYLLYNPFAGGGKGMTQVKELATKLGDSVLGLYDMTTIDCYAEFLKDKTEGDLLICGGDGTLNRFVNDTEGLTVPNEICYLPVGTGNDFLRDLEKRPEDCPLPITDYLNNLPLCSINGRTYRFLNNVGFGIDGYCCEVGDAQRAIPGKKVNYTMIAIKGLLFFYKPCNATVTVDGVTKQFKKVWLAPTMKGRYYGGGMMPTPAQDRRAPDGKLSLFLFHTTGKLRTLLIFPKIFKGEHLKATKATTVLEGHEITVRFDSPRAVQIDGETILGVTSYSVSAAAAHSDLQKMQTATV